MSKYKKEWSPEIKNYVDNMSTEEFSDMIDDIYQKGDQAQKDRINKFIEDETDENISHGKI
ncbi:hypothetical protein [Carnobacterium pleistocenium]|uniref:hypothetical protein n=1 Tax=Carnobacterium pleistocenium TaxID=181073 RepID=UPI000558F2EA|nr:hypothetical protein [Carnobacterium pleistocenium]